MILGILQARVSSSRLPGKVLLPILDEPMLARQIERLRRCLMIDQWILATSVEAPDDPLELLAEKLHLPCYRGLLDDVLDRFYHAADPYNPDHVVRLTGDCPLADPGVIDACIRHHLEGDYDHTGNFHPPTWPDGLDVEVTRFGTLKTAWQEATAPAEREHVTPYIYNHPDRFRIGNLASDTDRSDLRWTVDEPEDYEFVSRVYEALYPKNPEFGYADVLALLEKMPELGQLNSRFERNSKLKH